MRALLLPLLLQLSAGCFAVNTDSLWGVWNDATQPDTSRLEALHKFNRAKYKSDPDSLLLMMAVEFDFAVTAQSFKYQSLAAAAIGVVWYRQDDYEKASQQFILAAECAEKDGQKVMAAKNYGNTGNSLQKMGDYGRAVKYHQKAIQLMEEAGEPQNIGNILNSLGVIYKVQGDVDKALEYYTKCLDLAKQNEDSLDQSTALNNIGNVYKDIGEYEKALQFHSQSLSLRVALKKERKIASSYINIGNVYLKRQEFDEALTNFNKALEIVERLGRKRGIALAHSNIAALYLDIKNWNLCETHARTSYKISVEINDLENAMHAAYYLSESLSALGNYKEAHAMQEQHYKLRDSVLSLDNAKALIARDLEYNYKQQEDSLKLAQQQELELAEVEQKRRDDVAAAEQFTLWVGIFLGTGILLLVIIFAVIIYKRLRLTSEQKDVIESQKIEVEEKNREVNDSINYAQRIQHAILPANMQQLLPESFVLFKPKEAVSGDFYWAERAGETIYVAVADCTGHGVPGAMVSMVGNNGLNKCINEMGLREPAEILNNLSRFVEETFAKSGEDVKDGMDIALCAITGTKLEFAGANNPLYLVRNNEILITKGDKRPIGKHRDKTPFTNHNLELLKDDVIYLFSDGYADQFGGTNLGVDSVTGKKFKYKRFRELLLAIHGNVMDSQRQVLDDTIEKWKGPLEQIDDICIIGVRI